MKLSLWTISAWLRSRGLETEPAVSEGGACVSSMRWLAEGSCPESCVEIAPAGGGDDLAAVLKAGGDRLLVRGAGPVAVGNLLCEAFEAYNDWERRLYARAVSGAGLQELLDTAAEVITRPMFIKNDSSWILAITGGYAPDTHPYWATMEANAGRHITDYDTVRTVSTDPAFQTVFTEKYPSVTHSPLYGGMILHANLFSDERRIGEIVALENGVPFDPGEVHLMHSFAELAERYLHANYELLASLSNPAIFLNALIDRQKIDSVNMPAVYRALGIRESDELCLAVIEDKARSDTPLLGALRDGLAAQQKRWTVFSRENQVVCVVKLGGGESYDAFVDTLCRAVPADAFFCGLSFEFAGLDSLPAYYGQACAVLLRAAEARRPVMTMYEAAGGMISEKLASLPDAGLLIHPDVSRLRSADEREHTRHCLTLWNYLLCGGNYTDTAGIMGLHRNSLIYRMNRIRALMRTNPDDLKNRELLMASFLILGAGE